MDFRSQFIILVCNTSYGVRVSDDDEEVGVDVSECGLDQVHKIICKNMEIV